MDHGTNHFVPEAATDEPASPFHAPAPATIGDTPLDAPPAPSPSFASQAEEDAYWAGIADGIRNGGGTVTPRLAARARDAYPELVATADQLAGRAPSDPLDFEPVSLRHRIDGWTPDKQREYVEALADSGVARYAAARVGISEQSAARLRRRPEARAFDLACEAAIRLGARRIRSLAFERAIEGTIRRHYYHGELKSEERVFDNRLLVYLLGKLDRLVEPPPEAEAVTADWQPWMAAIEQGLPAPPAPPSDAEPEEDAIDDVQFLGDEVWEEFDQWWTSFPPPLDFDGEQHGELGEEGYCRSLTPAEQAVAQADRADERADETARECARRDVYFGFEGGVFSPREPEPYEPFSQAAHE